MTATFDRRSAGVAVAGMVTFINLYSVQAGNRTLSAGLFAARLQNSCTITIACKVNASSGAGGMPVTQAGQS